MPLYEYQCHQCEESFEKLVLSPATAQPVTCPTCGSGQVQKKLSLFSSKSAGMKVSAPSSASSACNTGGG